MLLMYGISQRVWRGIIGIDEARSRAPFPHKSPANINISNESIIS
jgi:hypothetical protein